MREKSLSKRAWVSIGAGVVAVAAIAAGVVLASRPDSEPAVVVDNTTAAITAPDSSISPSPADIPEVSGLAPGDLVATIAGDTVGIYDEPGDDSPRETLGRFSYYGNVRTFMGLATKDVDGTAWIHVQVPEYPNHTTAWVKADEVTTGTSDLRVNVYLDEREVDLLKDGAVELTSTAVVGAAKSPTPLGNYFIADPVDFTSNPSGTYGAYALGLSAYSETLETFKGALPQIALHGTNSTKYFGQAVSNGCVRLPDSTIREMAADTALGTPVSIYQNRDAATS